MHLEFHQTEHNEAWNKVFQSFSKCVSIPYIVLVVPHDAIYKIFSNCFIEPNVW